MMGLILVLMLYVCYLAVILIFFGGYCSLPSGYWWLLLVPTFSMKDNHRMYQETTFS